MFYLYVGLFKGSNFTYNGAMQHTNTNAPFSNHATSIRAPRIVVFGGGTITHLRSHFALCAPAYGTTARKIAGMLTHEIQTRGLNYEVDLRLTKMADAQSSMETNDEVEQELRSVLEDPSVVSIVFNVALCDFEGQVGSTPSGKYAERLQTRSLSTTDATISLKATSKLLGLVQSLRPDVMVVGFKTTAGDTSQGQSEKVQRQIQETGVAWVFANDTVTRNNMLVQKNENTQGEQVYSGPDREQALEMLARHLVRAARNAHE